jgi:sirohydrochlorin cobaltochelatase
MNDLERAAARRPSATCRGTSAGRDGRARGPRHLPQGQAFYAALEGRLAARLPGVPVVTLMGRPGFTELAHAACRRKPSKVHLVPFMCLPGHHVRVDLAGEDPCSWTGRLRALGIDAVCHLTGLALHAPFVDIWLDHLEKAVRGLHLEAA